jgi:hypothetical protein
MRRLIQAGMPAITMMMCSVALASAANGNRSASPSEEPTPPRILAPFVQRPKLVSPTLQVPRLNARKIEKPLDAGLDLTPDGCTRSACDPRRLAGRVISLVGRTLIIRTAGGRYYRALIDATTNVACPPQDAIDAGQVFNPLLPRPQIGGRPAVASTAQLGDRYACSVSALSPGRRVAGAVVGRDTSGALRWVGVALSPR